MNHNNEGPGKRPAFMDGPVRPLTVEETRAMAAYFVKEITEVRAESDDAEVILAWKDPPRVPRDW